MIWPLLGGLGQLCFALRCLVQWRAAERAGRSVAPRSFWWLSLCGAFWMALYTAAGGQTLLTSGYAAGAWIAVRNLQLQEGELLRRSALETAAVLGILVIAGLVGIADPRTASVARGWLAALWAGQLLWSTRFAVQWIHSEELGESHFPPMFWWLSLASNALLLAYAVHVWDLVLICAFAPGPLVQIRNLILSAREPVRELAG